MAVLSKPSLVVRNTGYVANAFMPSASGGKLFRFLFDEILNLCISTECKEKR